METVENVQSFTDDCPQSSLMAFKQSPIKSFNQKKAINKKRFNSLSNSEKSFREKLNSSIRSKNNSVNRIYFGKIFNEIKISNKSEIDVSEALKQLEDVEIIKSSNKSDFEFYRIVGMNKLFGVNHLIEFQIKQIDKFVIKAPKFYCRLCSQELVGNYQKFIIDHFESYKHKIALLKLRHPDDFNRLEKITDNKVLIEELNKINFDKQQEIVESLPVLIRLPNLENLFKKCCEALSNSLNSIEEVKPTREFISNDNSSNSSSTFSSGTSNFTLNTNNLNRSIIDHDYDINLDDTIQNYSDECSDSEIEDFIKEQGMNKSSMLRLKHLKRLRMTKNDVKLKENVKKFSDSLRYIASKIETEEERVKISNEILGIVQETFHVKNLNNLMAESAATKFRVESFMNEILKYDTNLFHYRFLTDIENIKSIRIYLENNVDCIDKEKQLKIAAKLREILNQAKIIQ